MHWYFTRKCESTTMMPILVTTGIILIMMAPADKSDQPQTPVHQNYLTGIDKTICNHLRRLTMTSMTVDR